MICESEKNALTLHKIKETTHSAQQMDLTNK